MITGALKSQVDRVWNAFAAGGISNPLTVIEQITYLLFTRRQDELQMLKEAQANLLGAPVDQPLFTRKQAHLRWSRFAGLLGRAELRPISPSDRRPTGASRFLRSIVRASGLTDGSV